MVENGFYKIKPAFVELINHIGGKYADQKERPVFCCVEDAKIKSLYWAIPTSDLSHRSSVQIEKIKNGVQKKAFEAHIIILDLQTGRQYIESVAAFQ